MIEYRIINAGSEAELAREVNNTIKEGWKPQGGVSVTKGLAPLLGHAFVWGQAMVKETK